MHRDGKFYRWTRVNTKWAAPCTRVNVYVVLVARGNINEKEKRIRLCRVEFSPLSLSIVGHFFFRCNKVASRAHEVTFRICAQPEKHLFDSQCYRASWKTGCGYPFSVSPVSRVRSESASDICDTTLLKSSSNLCRIDDSWQFSKRYVS